jgi:hypothetical protein
MTARGASRRLSTSEVGDFGEDTVAALLEARGDIVIALGGSGMPRERGRQDLDLVASVDGELVAFEVKSRCYGQTAGRQRIDGSLPKARLGRARPRRDGTRSFAQASREYVLERVAQFIDVGEDTDVDVRLFIVDLKSNLAQEYAITDGAVGDPLAPAIDCSMYMLGAVEQSFASDAEAAAIARQLVHPVRLKSS